MMAFNAISIWLIIVLYIGSAEFHMPGSFARSIIMIGFMIEYAGGFLFAAIGYALLARQWEGYHGHRFLHFLHYITLVFLSTILPHGDFLLHMGYRQRGYMTKALEEPFPDGFEFPRESVDLMGYLPRASRGGFLYFFGLGYLRCGLTLIRMGMSIGFVFGTSFYWGSV